MKIKAKCKRARFKEENKGTKISQNPRRHELGNSKILLNTWP
jgi:hypothetical protein